MMMLGTHSAAVVFIQKQIGSVAWADDVMDYGGDLPATLPINHTLTLWMLPQEPSLKLYPERSVVKLADFITAPAFIHLLFVCCGV